MSQQPQLVAPQSRRFNQQQQNQLHQQQPQQMGVEGGAVMHRVPHGNRQQMQQQQFSTSQTNLYDGTNGTGGEYMSNGDYSNVPANAAAQDLGRQYSRRGPAPPPKDFSGGAPIPAVALNQSLWQQQQQQMSSSSLDAKPRAGGSEDELMIPSSSQASLNGSGGRRNRSSKNCVLISACIAAAIVIAAVLIVVFVFFNPFSNKNNANSASNANANGPNTIPSTSASTNFPISGTASASAGPTSTNSAPAFSVGTLLSVTSSSTSSTKSVSSSQAPLPTVAPSGACVNQQIAREWRELSTPQQVNYINAMLCLRAAPSLLGLTGAGMPTTRWEDYEYVHMAMGNSGIIHSTPIFLIWHRAFIVMFSADLKTTCQYTGPPVYYDWSVDAQAIESSSIWQPTSFGGNGAFTTAWATAGFTTNVPTAHQLTRGWAGNGNNELFETSYTPAQMALILNSANYNSFQNALENGPHNNFHAGMGGDMSLLTQATNDPMFFMHHRNVDRYFWKWQTANPGAAVGFATTGQSISEPLTFLGLGPAMTVSDALLTNGGGANNLFCYTYSSSITTGASTTTSATVKRDPSYAGKNASSLVTPNGTDRTDLHKFRHPQPLSDAFIKGMNMDMPQHVAKIRQHEALIANFTDYINSLGHQGLRGSLGATKQGHANGWRSRTPQEEADEDKFYGKLIQGFQRSQ